MFPEKYGLKTPTIDDLMTAIHGSAMRLNRSNQSLSSSAFATESDSWKNVFFSNITYMVTNWSDDKWNVADFLLKHFLQRKQFLSYILVFNLTVFFKCLWFELYSFPTKCLNTSDMNISFTTLNIWILTLLVFDSSIVGSWWLWRYSTGAKLWEIIGTIKVRRLW